MNGKKHILVVEDVPFIYDEVHEVLEEAGFSVDEFTPSVEKAIGRINRKRPDLVLLDIQLKGAHNGIYLGNKLRNEYNIPYIYVTDYDDNYTFAKSTQTYPEAFLSKKTLQLQEDDVVVKTKPIFDQKHLLQNIIISLHRNEDKAHINHKEGLMAFVDLPKNLNDSGTDEVSQRPVRYSDIQFFTSKIIDIDSSVMSKVKANELKKEGRNIAKLITISKDPYYYRGNLSKIIETLPYNFVRINSSEILNITATSFDGRINGKRLVIGGKIYKISDTYKEEFDKRISHFY